MKSFLMLAAVCTLAAVLGGCNNNKTNDKASPGAMKECPKCATGTCACMCCKAGGTKMATATGCCCVGEVACCKDKTNMGAVGEKKSGCCSESKNGASMGAVGEKKAGCCSEKKSDASLGAVGEKKSCTAVCPVTGKSAE